MVQLGKLSLVDTIGLRGMKFDTLVTSWREQFEQGVSRDVGDTVNFMNILWCRDLFT